MFYTVMKRPFYDKADPVDVNQYFKPASLVRQSYFDLKSAVEELKESLDNGDRASARKIAKQVASLVQDILDELEPRRGRSSGRERSRSR